MEESEWCFGGFWWNLGHLMEGESCTELISPEAHCEIVKTGLWES